MPCSNNGSIPDSELLDIPGGRLLKPAAAAWNAPNGPAANGLRPSGPNASYRLIGPSDGSVYGTQWYFWTHQPPLAAYPGTSEHGCAKAVDLLEEWMRSWVDDHGARFGWAKIEAFSEWWHVNFVGGVSFPTFKVLKKGAKNRRVKWYARRLAFIHPRSDDHGYLRGKPRLHFDRFVEDSVVHFQADHGLKADGVIGEKTGHKISEIFHKQYVHRNKRRRLVRSENKKRRLVVKRGGRKRLLRDVVRLRP